jgi:hypothetical protein
MATENFQEMCVSMLWAKQHKIEENWLITNFRFCIYCLLILEWHIYDRDQAWLRKDIKIVV